MKHQSFVCLLFVSFLLGTNTNVCSNSNSTEIESLYLGRTSYCDKGDTIKEGNHSFAVDIDEFLQYIRLYGVNERDNNGNTVLHAAALYGDLDVIEMLLDEGADIDAKNNFGFTPLHLAAAKEQDLDSVKALVSGGASVNVQANNGDVPLMSIVKNSQSCEILEFLILHGADVNYKDKYGFTALHYAVFEGRYWGYSELLIAHGADINKQAYGGITPLHLAAYSHDSLAVELLLNSGADKSLRDIYGNLPLSFMLHGYNSKLAAMLLDDKSFSDTENNWCINLSRWKDELMPLLGYPNFGFFFTYWMPNDVILVYIQRHGLEERDSNGNTALHRAAMECNNDLLKIFLKEDVDRNIRNYYGLTPLHIIAAFDYDKDNVEAKKNCAGLFIDTGADVNSQAYDGKTPLMINLISYLKDGDLSLFFIKNGTDLSLKDNYGFTALHYAIIANNSYDVIKLLIESGANINDGSNFGITPLHLAVYRNDDAIVELLLASGADSNLEDIYGNKALHYMCHGYNHKIFSALYEGNEIVDVCPKDFLVVSELELDFLLAKHVFGAAFYIIFPDLEDEDQFMNQNIF